MKAQPWREACHPRRRLGADPRPFPARRFGLCFPLGEEEMRAKLRNSLGCGRGDSHPLYILNGTGWQVRNLYIPAQEARQTELSKGLLWLHH